MNSPRKTIAGKRSRLSAIILGISVTAAGTVFGQTLDLDAPSNDSLSVPSVATKAAVNRVGLPPSLTIGLEDSMELELGDLSADDVLETLSVPEDAIEVESVVAAETVLQAVGQPEQIVQRFVDGKPQVNRVVVEDSQGNYVNHGKFTEYAKDGSVVRTGSYQLGKLDGEWMQQLSAESLRRLTNTVDGGFQAPFESRAEFKEGTLSGIWAVTDAKGNPVFVWQFADGQRDNTSAWYNSRGEIIREIVYHENVADGPATVFDSKNRKTQQIQLDKGRLVKPRVDWYTNTRYQKRKKSEESVLVPYIATLEAHDWWNSTVATSPLGDETPVRHGTARSWHSNGQLAFEGEYSQGRQNGEFKWYFENGQPRIRGHYADGNRIGEWTWWHTNGMKRARGQFDAGASTGIWSAWASTGTLLNRGNAEEIAALIEPVQEPATSASASAASPRPTQSQTRVRHHSATRSGQSRSVLSRVNR